MLRFKQYIVEYLTPKQFEKYSSVEMTPKARKDTDPHFGEGNDVVRGKLDTQHPDLVDKSEVHKAVERHLDKPLTHTEYFSGLHTDKHGRQVRIGKSIKDESLRNQYSQDTSRAGSRSGHQFTTSTVRGVHVAGQTNPEPNDAHPSGHSWADASCKNIENGCNKHYLKHEIKHGSVVHFIHDKDGKEIYRATLQPHHNEHGDVAYAVDSEYGIKHPEFRKSADKAASDLSGEYKPGMYKKHESVYDDNDVTHVLHPKATVTHITKALKDKDVSIRLAAIHHPNATPEHITKALNDSDRFVRQAALKHPGVTSEHITKALGDENVYNRIDAIKHPSVKPEHITKALEDSDSGVRGIAINKPNATSEHITKALNDEDQNIRRAALRHPNASAYHVATALHSNDQILRENAIRHPKADPDNITMALRDPSWRIRVAAAEHPNATPEHITKALNDSDEYVRGAAAGHAKASISHLTKAMNDHSSHVREAALYNKNATLDHVEKGLNDTNADVRMAARYKERHLKNNR